MNFKKDSHPSLSKGKPLKHPGTLSKYFSSDFFYIDKNVEVA